MSRGLRFGAVVAAVLLLGSTGGGCAAQTRVGTIEQRGGRDVTLARIFDMSKESEVNVKRHIGNVGLTSGGMVGIYLISQATKVALAWRSKRKGCQKAV